MDGFIDGTKILQLFEKNHHLPDRQHQHHLLRDPCEHLEQYLDFVVQVQLTSLKSSNQILLFLWVGFYVINNIFFNMKFYRFIVFSSDLFFHIFKESTLISLIVILTF